MRLREQTHRSIRRKISTLLLCVFCHINNGVCLCKFCRSYLWINVRRANKQIICVYTHVLCVCVYKSYLLVSIDIHTIYVCPDT